MNRRHTLGLAIGLFLVPAIALAANPAANAPAQAMTFGGTIDYTPELHDLVKQTQKPYILDFFATWCGTCRAQERTVDRLREQNPDYNMLTILKVNWDAYRNEPVARDLKIPRRSTLVLMVGETEIDRIVASTRIGDIQNLLDLGLSQGQRPQR